MILVHEISMSQNHGNSNKKKIEDVSPGFPLSFKWLSLKTNTAFRILFNKFSHSILKPQIVANLITMLLFSKCFQAIIHDQKTPLYIILHLHSLIFTVIQFWSLRWFFSEKFGQNITVDIFSRPKSQGLLFTVMHYAGKVCMCLVFLDTSTWLFPAASM